MTSIALHGYYGTSASISLPVRAISDEADKLRGLIFHAIEFQNSVTIGEPWRESLMALEEAFEQAREDGWDGYGASRAEYPSYEYAYTFLCMLPAGHHPPDISVDPDGEISFEWDFGPRQIFSVSVGRDGSLTYAGLYGWSKAHGVEHLGETIPESIVRNIERVHRAENPEDVRFGDLNRPGIAGGSNS